MLRDVKVSPMWIRCARIRAFGKLLQQMPSRLRLHYGAVCAWCPLR